MMPTPDYAELFRRRMVELCVAVTGDPDKPSDLAAELRLKERNIARYMSGTTQPFLREAAKIAANAGVSLDWLAGLSEDGGPAAPVPSEPPEGDTPPPGYRPRRTRGAR